MVSNSRQDYWFDLRVNTHKGYYQTLESYLLEKGISKDHPRYNLFQESNSIIELNHNFPALEHSDFICHSLESLFDEFGFSMIVSGVERESLGILIDFAINRPDFGGSLYIEKNPHLENGETMEEHIISLEGNDEDLEFIKYCEGGLYSIQYYPRTPISFIKLYGAHLGSLAQQVYRIYSNE